MHTKNTSQLTIEKPEIVDPKSDYGFKRLFGSEKNKEYTISAINILLGDLTKSPVLNIEFLRAEKRQVNQPADLIYPNPNRIPDAKYQKRTSVDVLCTDTDGNRFIVEMQRESVDNFFKRILFYSCSTYADQCKVSGKYDTLKRVHFLSFVEHNLLEDEESYVSHFSLANHRSPYRRRYDLTLTFVELCKFDRTINRLHNDLEKWIYFIKHAPTTPEDILKQTLGNTSIYSRAYDILKTSSFTPDELAAYRLEQIQEMDYQSHITLVREEGMRKGEQEGMRKGEQKGRREFAQALIENGYTPTQIAGMIKLKVHEVEELIASK